MCLRRPLTLFRDEKKAALGWHTSAAFLWVTAVYPRLDFTLARTRLLLKVAQGVGRESFRDRAGGSANHGHAFEQEDGLPERTA